MKKLKIIQISMMLIALCFCTSCSGSKQMPNDLLKKLGSFDIEYIEQPYFSCEEIRELKKKTSIRAWLPHQLT